MSEIHEISRIDSLTRLLARYPRQINRSHESDAELVRIPGMSGILACTTDVIVEEIEAGLYRDPNLIGWMAVTVNASDLAAVGADPIGILITEALPDDLGAAARDAMQAGVRDACAAYGMYVLGGDTSRARSMAVGGCAIGVIPEGEQPLTRLGCRPGDGLFATGLLGTGSAYAFLQLSRRAGIRDACTFRPRARVAEGRILRRFASACIDTSDGVLAACGELARLNRIGIEIEGETERHLEPCARQIAVRAGLPAWTMLAGPHGEFELLFTVPRESVDGMMDAAAAHGWRPLRLGRVTGKRAIVVPGPHAVPCRIDTTRLRNIEFGGQDGFDRSVKEVLSCASPAVAS